MLKGQILLTALLTALLSAMSSAIELSILDLLWIALAAVAAGFVNAIAGGGSLISFPVLTAIGLPPVMANVTNTVALLPGYGGAAVAQRRDLRGQRRRALVLLPASALGGVLGGMLLLVSDKRFFGSLVPWLILLGLQDPLRRWLQTHQHYSQSERLELVAVGPVFLAAIYSSNGWLGGPIQALFGLKVSFTWLGVAIAMVFISLPFVVRSVEPVLEALEHDQEEAAWCLGASPRQTLLNVVLPQLMPAILAGVAQGYSRAVGEYGSVVMISSNVPFRDLITPTLIIQKLEEYDFASATVIGMVMLLFSLLSLLVINGLQVWGRNWEANPAQSA